MKLLVIEDDVKTVKYLRKGFAEHGFTVDVCRCGEEGLETALAARHDLVILDVTLPVLDGWTILQRMRASLCATPVVMLTARDAVQYRVKGLSLGADDYLVKPFSFAELLARVRSVLRRVGGSRSDMLEYADLTVDPRRFKAFRGGQAIELSVKEFQLLELLLSRQGEVLSRTEIAEMVWEMSFDSDSNFVDVSIRRLRAKIDDPFPRKLIQTVRGRGYVLR